jgi:hypothetical protein
MTASQAVCGPAKVSFDAKADSTHHPTPQPDPAKATVYVIADLGQCSDCGKPSLDPKDVADAVIKVGMDGQWIGASRGNSYLFVVTEPGAHHMCLNWQSSLEERSRAFAMTNLTAEAGKVYYLRARLFPGGNGDFSFDLDRFNSDEGKYLVASSAFSVSRPKK